MEGREKDESKGRDNGKRKERSIKGILGVRIWKRIGIG